MRRLLYLSGDEITAFHWSGQQVQACLTFTLDDMHAFRDYLASTQRIPLSLLVDVSDEDLHFESQTKTSQRNRQLMIARNLKRLFRQTQHVCALYLGPEKDSAAEKTSLSRKPKKDSLVLSALADDASIQPWLQAIEEYRVPLVGIWSLPLLTQSLVKQHKNVPAHGLLVTQQAPAVFRFSYFHHGQLKFSRKTEWHHEDDAPYSPIAWGQRLVDNLHSTCQFLENQKYIAESKIAVTFWVQDAFYAQTVNQVAVHKKGRYQVFTLTECWQQSPAQLAKNLFVPRPIALAEVKTADIEQMTQALTGELSPADHATTLSKGYADRLFAKLLHQLAVPQHYATTKEKKIYQRWQWDRWCWRSAVAALVLTLSLGSVGFINIQDWQQQTQQLARTVSEKQQLYQQQYALQTTQFANADTWQAALNVVKQLHQQQQFTPMDFYQPLSRVLNESAFADIVLKKLQWQRQSPATTTDESAESNTATAADTAQVMIEGSIELVPGQYRKNLAMLQAFADRLSALPSAKNLKILQLPLEIRSDQAMQADAANQKAYRSAFSIQIEWQFQVQREIADDALAAASIVTRPTGVSLP
jgi:hypothetical protein